MLSLFANSAAALPAISPTCRTKFQAPLLTPDVAPSAMLFAVVSNSFT